MMGVSLWSLDFMVFYLQCGGWSLLEVV
jgi:hypothetical protein